jgi:general secretion pathway protein B
MSLILDALKKSEAERQRQTGPTLLEVRVTAPRRRYPAWVIAVGALLALNLVLLLVFLLRRPSASQTDAAPEAAAAVSTPAAVPAAAKAAPQQGGAPPLASGAVAAMNQGTAGAGAEVPLSVTGSTDAQLPRTLSPPQAVGDGADNPHNPADDEPAVPPGGGKLEGGSAGHYASLPSFSEVGGNLPDLRLDLHVYAERARDRYALINMHRVQEGDALPEGPRVLAITREGVALDYRGQEFMLRPQ